MSYIKPKLIEPKIQKLIINKLEERKNKFILKEQEINQNNIIEIPVSTNKKILNFLIDFLKKNYIFIIIIILTFILLYVRYIETKKRKEQLKHILDEINQDD
jgi:predicted PurR-regulated permease PerM